MPFSSWFREGTVHRGPLPTLRTERWAQSPTFAPSLFPLSVTQNNPGAKVACFKVAYSATLQDARLFSRCLDDVSSFTAHCDRAGSRRTYEVTEGTSGDSSLGSIGNRHGTQISSPRRTREDRGSGSGREVPCRSAGRWRGRRNTQMQQRLILSITWPLEMSQSLFTLASVFVSE